MSSADANSGATEPDGREGGPPPRSARTGPESRTIVCFSDLHANLPALEAGLGRASSQGAHVVLVAGDVVGDGPHPGETIQLLRRRRPVAVRGNVDREVSELASPERDLEERARDPSDARTANRAWTALRLDPEAREWLRTLPARRALEIGGRRILLVHGSPLDDTDYVLPDITGPELESKLSPLNRRPDVLVCGHSHRPFVRRISGILVVNCGSVGRPADGDPRGSLALVDLPAERRPTGKIVRFRYSVRRVVRDLKELAVPGVDPRDWVVGRKS